MLLRLFYTLRYLKPRQVCYRGYYRLRNQLVKPGLPSEASCRPKRGASLAMLETVPRSPSLSGSQFTFLNQGRDFPDAIDWDFSDYGRLWTYNLNYFDFLNQEGLESSQGVRMVRGYLAGLSQRRVGLEPYPTSLRIINWVKFLVRHQIRDAQIEQGLYRQALHLRKNLEYHLLGNHLLENGFALLFSAALFPQGPFSRAATRIVRSELGEQILSDGGHFELSPMYHLIILDRLLDSINILQSNNLMSDLLPILREKCSLMLGWLGQITWADGEIPLVNDSALGIAPSSAQIFSYAERLGVPTTVRPLGATGYRMFRKRRYEMLIDVGRIGPDYLPGHAHSDTFNFVLQVQGRPVIVDTGTSTYQNCPRRMLERGTAAHNCVQVDSMDQSEVWDSFRVARRARVSELQEDADRVSASHDGYSRIGVRHTRTFECSEAAVTIHDDIVSAKKHDACARIHFHPDVVVVLNGALVQAGPVRIAFSGGSAVTLKEFSFAPRFNTLVPARMVEIAFSGRLTTRITIGESE